MISLAFPTLVFALLKTPAVQTVGRYECLQHGGAIVRTLILEPSGRAEIVTEFRRGPRDWTWRGEVEPRYGLLAEAATQKPVHHVGHWKERDGDLKLRLDRANVDARRVSYGIDFRLERRNGALIVKGDRETYGRETIRFVSVERPTAEPVDGVYGITGTGRSG